MLCFGGELLGLAAAKFPRGCRAHGPGRKYSINAVGVWVVDVEAVQLAVGGQVDAGLALGCRILRGWHRRGSARRAGLGASPGMG